MQAEFIPWIGFLLFVVAMLVLDLGVLNRRAHEIKMREAVIWSVFWTLIAIVFNVWVWYTRGTKDGVDFLTGYILERSLSLDNLFVFLVIFAYFKVEGKYQHRVLFWGIIGALVFRAIFIASGITLIRLFSWTLYVMGAFLVFTGIKIAFHKSEGIELDKNPVVRFCSKYLRMTDTFVDGKFFVRKSGKIMVTPLFMVLLLVESSDVVFAFDSVPAILAITQDPYIVFTSNVMAILGMRALYFALHALYKLFHRLQVGLSIVLVFIGLKMLLADYVHFPVWITLSVVVVLITGSMLASIIWPPKPVTEN